MSVQDLSDKRSVYFQRVQDYQTALESGDQQAIDDALDQAIAAGKEYADQIGETSKDESLTADDLFSDTSELTQALRDKVRDEMWNPTHSESG